MSDIAVTVTSPGSIDATVGVGGTVSATVSSGGSVAVNLPAGEAAWANITGKPTTFTPSAHTHKAADITDRSTALVTSVNGKTGDVTITEGGGGSSYTLPTATDTVLGGVKIGSGITITDGVISAAAGGGVSLSNAAPSDLGIASAGASGDASRADHVHEMPDVSGVLGLSAALSAKLDAESNVDGGDYVGVVITPGPSITITAQPTAQSAIVGNATTQAALLPSGAWDNGVTYADGEYWIVASDNLAGDYYATSPDGLTWTKKYGFNRAGFWNPLVYGDGRYAVTDGTYLQASTNGTTWTESQVGGKVFFANGKWLRYWGDTDTITSLSGWNSLQLYKSDDLVTWASAGAPSKTLTGSNGTFYYKPGRRTLSRFFYVNGVYVAMFNESSAYNSGGYLTGYAWVFTSTDLLTWTAVAGGPENFTGWANDFTKPIPSSSSFWASKWETPQTINGEVWSRVTWSRSDFARSTDGVSWTGSSVPNLTQGTESTIAYGNGVYVAPVGSRIYSSSNGSTWVERTNPAGTNFSRAAFVDGNLWLLGRGASSVVRSTNGIDWTAISGLEPADTGAMAQNGSVFVGQNTAGTKAVRLNLSGSATEATFSVAAYYDAGTLTYQWQLSTDGGSTWANVTDATASTLVLTGLTAADSGKRYRAIISATGATPVTSNAATLTVT